MKTNQITLNKFLSTLLLLILLFISAISTFGQCNKFAKKMDVSAIKLFENCEGVQAAKMYPGENAVISQAIKSNSTYRILIDSDEYLGEVQLLIDKSDNRIEVKQTSTYYDVKTTEDMMVMVKIVVPQKETLNQIERSGCVAIAVASGGVEDLAEVK